MGIRKKIRNALNEYVDEHRGRILHIVDKNLIKLKEDIVEKLPDKLLEFLKKHADDGDDQNDTFLENMVKFITLINGKLSDDFKEDVRTSTREHLDEVTKNSPEDITNLIVKFIKKVILEVTTKSDNEEEKKKKSTFFKSLDLGILKDGREGIVVRIVEFIKPPIHEAGDNIKKNLINKLPGRIRDKLINEASGGLIGSKSTTSDRGIFHNHHHHHDDDGDGEYESKLKKIFGKFKKDNVEEGGKKKHCIRRMFEKLPHKIDKILTPHIIEFEQRLIEHIEDELKNNIFKHDKFKGGVKSTLSKYENNNNNNNDDDDDDDDDNGKDDDNLINKIGSMFKKK